MCSKSPQTTRKPPTAGRARSLNNLLPGGPRSAPRSAVCVSDDDDEDNSAEERNLRQRRSDIKYAEPQRGQGSYDELVGTMGRQLKRDVGEVMAFVLKKAGGTKGQRYRELLQGLMEHGDMQGLSRDPEYRPR